MIPGQPPGIAQGEKLRVMDECWNRKLHLSRVPAFVNEMTGVGDPGGGT